MTTESISKRKYMPTLFEITIVTLFILISDDTLMFGTNNNSLFILVKYIYIFSATVTLLIKYLLKTQLMPQNEFLTIGMMAVLIFISMVLNNDIRIGYFYKIVLILYAWLILKNIGLYKFINIFNHVMLVLASISIIGFFSVCVNFSVLSLSHTIVNTAGTQFYDLFLFVSPKSFYSDYVRNYGIFREPGVYQMYLVLGMLFQHFMITKKRMFWYVIYTIAIVTTMSTTGYIALALFIVVVIVDGNGLTTNQKVIFSLLIIVGFIFIVKKTSILSLSQDDKYNSVFGKLASKKRGTSVSRFASITENIRIMITNPIFGVGLQKLSDLFPIYTLNNYGVRSEHNTNTILIQFSTHGFIYGITWLRLLLRSTKIFSSKLYVLIFFILIIIFSGENLTFSGFSSLIIMMSFEKSNELEV